MEGVKAQLGMGEAPRLASTTLRLLSRVLLCTLCRGTAEQVRVCAAAAAAAAHIVVIWPASVSEGGVVSDMHLISELCNSETTHH